MTAPSGDPPRPRRALRVLAGLYLTALAFSTLTRLLSPPPEPPPGRVTTQLPVVRSDASHGTDVTTVAWLEWRSEATTTHRLPVFALHGSPGSAGNFRTLGPALAALGHDVFAIDLPGFGASSRDIPSYSILAHAQYVLDVADHLGVDRFHVLGFSMGGGVSLHMAEMAPERVASVSLISAIGVQELELLGNYHLNHAVHGAQLAFFWSLRNITPHFGLFDHGFLDHAYCRNFFDTDQRPLRGILEELETPVYVLHGEHDFLVPVAAAYEHARVAPHSRLEILDRSHFFIFRGGAGIAPNLAAFLASSESDSPPTRATATAERLAAATQPFDPSVVPPWTGPALLSMMLIIIVATFILEDLTCIWAGILVAQGRIEYIPAVIACYIGIVIGDILLFWVGRILGRRSLRLPPFKWWVKEEALERSSQWLDRRGALVILVTRFIPGARLPTNLASGVLRTQAPRFALYFAIAGIFWTPPFVAASAWLGAAALEQFGDLRFGAFLAVLAIAVVIFLVRKLVLPLFTWKGRRKLLGRMKRLTRWEYWPSWAIYPPVALYILWLGLRRGSLTAFTAANPTFPAGGGIRNDSKIDILNRFESPGAWMPRWTSFSTADDPAGRTQQLLEFLAENEMTFPVVLKPATGERGKGIVIADDVTQARGFFERTPGPCLAQEFIPGVEAGIFYTKTPESLDAELSGRRVEGDRAGRIIAIGRKSLPSVIGDGQRTLDALILADPRAVALHATYLRENPDAASIRPAAGESVRLVEVGAHSRGTLFTEAPDLWTAELEQAVDEISRHFPGFDFGRYDFKAPSIEHLKRGENLHLIELNGSTSEATGMYDPRNGIFTAWRQLARQWRLLFELADVRRSHGQRPIGLRAFLRIALGPDPHKVPGHPRGD